MLKMLTAAALALSLALPGAAQAQGMSRNDKAIIGTIAGVAAVAVIANQLSKKDEKKVSHNSPPPPYYGHDRGKGNGPDWGRHNGRDWGKGHGRPGDKGIDRTLSGSCMTVAKDRRGKSFEMLRHTCLQKTGVLTRYLPDRCELTAKVKRENVRGYSASCLKSAGFRISRR